MKFRVSNTSMDFFPVECLFCIIKCTDGKTIEVPRAFPINGKWGEPVSYEYDELMEYGLPVQIDVVYVSIIEKKAYSLEATLNDAILMEVSKDDKIVHSPYIVVGLGPLGFVSIWWYSERKCVMVGKFNASQIDIPDGYLRIDKNQTILSICQQYIERYKYDTSKLKNISSSLLSKMNSKFQFRYSLSFNWGFNENKKLTESGGILAEIRDRSFDGAYDNEDPNKVTNYHFSSIPKYINVEWNEIGKSYSLYIFSDYDLVETMGRFYGAHPETKTDFIIRIDAENKKYELALYRQGLKEPVVIPESAYQLIVFKNKFEDYRSENYNQPRGAWIW